MMYEQLPIGLAVVYVFAVAILLLILVYGRLSWTLKAGLTVASLLFFALSYRSYTELSGMPSKSPPPKQLQFISTMIREPKGDFPGAIYLWVRPVVDGTAALVPQAFTIMYDKELHKRMNEARGRQRKGHKVMLEANISEDEDEDAEGQPWGYQQKHLDISIMQTREPQLPEKSRQYLEGEDANDE